MEFFRIKKDIPFMRYALVFNVISLLTSLFSVFFLFYNGLHLSVEFTGGTMVEVNYAQAANLEQIRAGLGKAGDNDTTAVSYTHLDVYKRQGFDSQTDVYKRQSSP